MMRYEIGISLQHLRDHYALLVVRQSIESNSCPLSFW